MMTPEQWTEIIIKRLAPDPFKKASPAVMREWLAELVEEIQIDAQPVKGHA